jgi:diphthamide biosynthesis protein 4
MSATHYQVLDVPVTASLEDIRRSYQRLLLVTHPDKNGGEDRGFTQLQDAWKTLSDGKLRADYDGALMRERLVAQREQTAHIHCRAEDMGWDEESGTLSMPCRCGGSFTVSEDVDASACVVSCSLCSYKLSVEL